MQIDVASMDAARVAGSHFLPQPIRSAAGYAISVPRVVVRKAELRDVYTLARGLRESDRAEQIALGKDPKRILRFSFRHSLSAPEVCVIDGEVAAMWGLGGDILSDEGQPWLMTGPAVERIPVSFVKIAQDWIEQALAQAQTAGDIGALGTFLTGASSVSSKFAPMQGSPSFNPNSSAGAIY